MTKRQKGEKIKRQKDKRQRPKREFDIVTSGQFRTLAMFFVYNFSSDKTQAEPLSVIFKTSSHSHFIYLKVEV